MPDLISIVGFAPASINMLYWGGAAQASDFSSDYLLTGATVTSGVVSPSGLTNAQKLVENSASGNHFLSTFDAQPQTGQMPSALHRVAVIAKAAERTRIVVVAAVYAYETLITASVGFDLAGGNVGYDLATGSQTAIDAYSMTSLGSGWWLCMFDYHNTGSDMVGTNGLWPKIYIDNGSGTAARSISYTGNGTSGVNLWWFNLLPTVAWSINQRQLRDDFDNLSTIDLGDTLTPGFNWYIRNSAPNSSYPNWWSPGVLPASLPENFTISSPSILKIYNPNNNAPQWSSMMYSVGFPVSGGYVGNAWQAPVIIDGYFSWDGSKNYANYGGLGPAFWGHSVEAMTGEIGSTGHWLEWDAIDIGGQTGGVFDHLLTSGALSTYAGMTWNPIATVGSKMHEGEFHRISGLWIGTTSNNGLGMFMSFYDGAMIPFTNTCYSVSSGTFPASAYPADSFYDTDAQHIPIMVDTGNNTGSGPGGGWPMFIDWIQVYTVGSPIVKFRHGNIGTRAGSRQTAQQ